MSYDGAILLMPLKLEVKFILFFNSRKITLLHGKETENGRDKMPVRNEWTTSGWPWTGKGSLPTPALVIWR